MGYYANGDVTISKTKAHDTQFVLGIQILLDNTSGYKLSDITDASKDGSLFEGCLRLSGLDASGDYPDSKNLEAQVYSYSFEQKWRGGDFIEPFLRYCASNGMRVEGNFVGEDAETWGYRSNPKDNSLKDISYYKIDGEEYALKNAKSKLLDILNDSIKEDSRILAMLPSDFQMELDNLYPKQ